ncbi:MAG: hypothetical protein PHU85_07155, partial [Phycisphaerae bacterium]|nr:hypothetical protein [Phycisphaerae bacterium]
MALLKLSDPVQFLKGVGPARAAVFAELGIRTVGELLFYFPRDLSHLPGRMPVAQAIKQKDGVVTVAGVLERCRWHGNRWKPVFSCRLADNTAAIDVTWFNAGWLRKEFGEHDQVILSGKLRPGRYGPTLTNPKITRQESEAGERLKVGQWEPVYPASAAISSRQIQQVVQRNLSGMLRLVEDFFPPQYLRRRELPDRWLAVGRMHFPAMSQQQAVSAPGSPAAQPPVECGSAATALDARPGASAKAAASLPHSTNGEESRVPVAGPSVALDANLPPAEVQARYAAARRRLAWDEAFMFQLALAVRRRSRQTLLRATPMPCDERIRERILRRFPFALTAAQARAIGQICGDLAKPEPMN